jgi:hypothetical protein
LEKHRQDRHRDARRAGATQELRVVRLGKRDRSVVDVHHLRHKAWVGCYLNIVEPVRTADRFYNMHRAGAFFSRASLYTLLQILSVSVFEKMPILSAFRTDDLGMAQPANDKKLSLFSL